MTGSKWILSIVIWALTAVPLSSVGGELVLKDKQVTVRVSAEIVKDEDKASAIKDYQIMERIQSETRNHVGGMPATTKVDVLVTGFRLRSGKSAFFGGGFTGSDVIEAEITIRDKGKQLHYFNIEATNSSSGKRYPPTRRVHKMVRKFGDRLARKLRRAMPPQLPQNIEIHIR